MTYKKLVFKDNCIDFIRLIAAMIVMFSHSFRWFGVDKPIWGLYFTDGSVGVITFNVLSGFLIFSSWERFRNSETCIKKRIKKYAISRIFRIYPALIVSCILICILDIIVRRQNLIINMKTPLKIILYCVAAFQSEPIKGGYSNGVLWTLFNEIILYCLIPIFYPLLRALKKWQFGILIFACWGVNLADHFIINIPKTKYIFEILGGGGAFPIIMYEYLIGIFIFCFMDDIIPILRNSTFLITSIILWSIYYYVYSYTGILPQFGETHHAVFGITLPWIVMGIAYKFNIRFKYDISYGIYLYHMPIIQLLIDFTQKNSSCLPIVWILVILLSSISCIFIERPFIKLKSSFQ